MALWGNKDNKTASGQVVINSDGYVTGSGTAFTTQAKVGNTMTVAGVQYVITVIDSDTEATVTAAKHGDAITVVGSNTAYALSEKPVYVSQSESTDTSGDSGDSSKVFGVDRWEVYSGTYNITDVSIVQGGSNYTEVPAITFGNAMGSGTAAIATIFGGVVTAIEVTSGGGWYDLPTVYIAVPRRTIPTLAVNTTAETITYLNHNLTTGDALTYYGSGLAPTVQDEDTVYAININNTTFKLATSRANALAGTAINLTGTGNNEQYFDLQAPAGVTATAVAVKGAGQDQNDPMSEGESSMGEQHVTHAGWVRKTVGTGGRAGRVQYETLVAMGSIQGDAADDIQFPDD